MSIENLLPHEIVETGSAPKACIIFLHGLGASGDDFVPFAHELKLPVPVRYIFPHAPSRPVTINGGMIMPAWYDILSMDIDRKIDVPQIKESSNAIHAFIRLQIKQGIPANKIIIAGFSQGGAVAYHAALSFPEPLAGLMALSTYFATEKELDLKAVAKDLPILIQHGTHDPVVPALLGERANAHLKKHGFAPKHLTYPMQHNVCPDQVFDINQWLNERLA